MLPPSPQYADAPICYAVPSEATSPRWCAAFAAGCGGSVIELGPLRPTAPAAMFGSAKLWRGVVLAAQRTGRPWFYGDHGYFGRFKYYRITRGAYQHDGRGEGDRQRLAMLNINPRPWRRGGRHVLVCPPDSVFAGLMGVDSRAWLRTTLGRLTAVTDRPIRVRSRSARAPLVNDLKDAHALVTMMSNAAVEALLFGVPVICTHRCAAQIMGLADPADVEAPAYPYDRERWAAVLAGNQWTLEEMSSGVAWAALREVAA
ncbi:MAG: hypothetical protein VW338_16090 [Rhodospirillaceae bacterium]